MKDFKPSYQLRAMTSYNTIYNKNLLTLALSGLFVKRWY